MKQLNGGIAYEPLEQSKGDRLLQLLIKGMLYEACEDFCTAMATEGDAQMRLHGLINGRLFIFTRFLFTLMRSSAVVPFCDHSSPFLLVSFAPVDAENIIISSF